MLRGRTFGASYCLLFIIAIIIICLFLLLLLLFIIIIIIIIIIIYYYYYYYYYYSVQVYSLNDTVGCIKTLHSRKLHMWSLTVKLALHLPLEGK